MRHVRRPFGHSWSAPVWSAEHSFNLPESGLPFVKTRCAYFWAALLPVGPAVKVGWDVLRNSKVRDIYLWGSLAPASPGVWVAAYASVYPTLSKSVDEHIESLSVFDQGRPEGAMTAAGAKWVDVVTVAAQAVAEIFLSAVLGIYMTMIYAKHRTVRLVGNPLFTQVDEERRSLEENVARERMALGEAKGNRTRLENQLVALLAYAKSMFQKELALRRDQASRDRRLDQLSQHLRRNSQCRTAHRPENLAACSLPRTGSSKRKLTHAHGSPPFSCCVSLTPAACSRKRIQAASIRRS
jgi:hypothetical protein